MINHNVLFKFKGRSNQHFKNLKRKLMEKTFFEEICNSHVFTVKQFTIKKVIIAGRLNCCGTED